MEKNTKPIRFEIVNLGIKKKEKEKAGTDQRAGNSGSGFTHWDSNGSLVWTKYDEGNLSGFITDREKALLMKKHRTETINFERSLAVKNCMEKGMPRYEILLRLMSKKTGYGKRSLAAAHAALSQAKREAMEK